LLADGHPYTMNLELIASGIGGLFVTLIGFIWKASSAHSAIVAEIEALKVADAQRKAEETAMNAKIDGLTKAFNELNLTIARLVTILEVSNGDVPKFARKQ